MTLVSGWANTDDVVRNQYGALSTDESKGGEYPSSGVKREVEYVVSYDNLPGGSAVGEMDVTIPANAVILDAYYEVITPFAGGTSYDIGLQQTNGSTEIDYDGLWDALVLADINAEGERGVMSAHAGTNSAALANTTLAAEAQLRVAATGSFTAGKMRIVIEYIPAKV